MSSTRFVIVSTTVPTESVAQRMAHRIVSSRLAACVQFWPIRSLYWWNNRIQSNTEALLVCKTKTPLARELQDFIRRLHSYEVPEVIVTAIQDGLRAYFGWLADEVTPRKEASKECFPVRNKKDSGQRRPLRPSLTFGRPAARTTPVRRGRKA